MKQVISHKTGDLMIDGIIDQDQLKIGTSSASVVGILFDNGNENLPGIQFVIHPGGVTLYMDDTSNNNTCTFELSNPGSSGYDRIWTGVASDGSDLTLKTGNGSNWIIYKSGDMFYAMTEGSSTENPWDGCNWRTMSTDAYSSNLLSVQEEIPPTQEWQYSVNGVDWFPIQKASNEIVYEPITITADDLDSTGSVTIQHKLGTQYPLGLDYTVTPDEITFTDINTLSINFSNQVAASFPIQVWFMNSKQNMLVTQGDGA